MDLKDGLLFLKTVNCLQYGRAQASVFLKALWLVLSLNASLHRYL